MAHPKETLNQEPCVKIKDLFSYFLENFKPLSCEKKFVHRSSLGLNHSCLLTSTSAAKNYDGWLKSKNVFTNRVLVEKHISGIMCENSGGHGPPPCPLSFRLKFAA